MCTGRQTRSCRIPKNDGIHNRFINGLNWNGIFSFRRIIAALGSCSCGWGCRGIVFAIFSFCAIMGFSSFLGSKSTSTRSCSFMGFWIQQCIAFSVFMSLLVWFCDLALRIAIFDVSFFWEVYIHTRCPFLIWNLYAVNL